jgi:hypothetical protein
LRRFTPANAGQHGNSGNHGPSTHTASTQPNTPDNAGPKTTGSTNGNSGESHGSHGPADSDSSANNIWSEQGRRELCDRAARAEADTEHRAPVEADDKTHRIRLQGHVFEAAYGFKNLGQFVAATNVSRNLGIPFDQLKLQLTGLSVDPNGNVTKAARRARSHWSPPPRPRRHRSPGSITPT